MANAINTGNPVPVVPFIVNKYDDISGSRVNQETPRGRLCFIDTNGRLTLPRLEAEAKKAVFPVDWPKPLNPPPYFDGPGLNGAPPYAFSDGSLDAQENEFLLDPDQAYQTPWPIGVKQYDLPPALYGLPVTSGNKALYYDGGVFTYGSGNFVGAPANYTPGAFVYAAYGTGNEGKITYAASGTLPVAGVVEQVETFGDWTITVRLRGVAALAG